MKAFVTIFLLVTACAPTNLDHDAGVLADATIVTDSTAGHDAVAADGEQVACVKDETPRIYHDVMGRPVYRFWAWRSVISESWSRVLICNQVVYNLCETAGDGECWVIENLSTFQGCQETLPFVPFTGQPYVNCGATVEQDNNYDGTWEQSSEYYADYVLVY